MKNQDNLYVVHIAEAISRLEHYFHRIKSPDDLWSHQMELDAIVRNFEIIGEASKHLSKDTRLKYNTIVWENIIGMRNILVHEYFDIDVQIIWSTFHYDIPQLKAVIHDIIKNNNIEF